MFILANSGDPDETLKSTITKRVFIFANSGDPDETLKSTITKSVYILANSGDHDETPPFAASHLGLRCLYMFPFRMHSGCFTSAYFEF